MHLILTDGGAKWAKTNPDTSTILAEPAPTQEAAIAFKNFIQESLPAQTIDKFVGDFDLEPSKLHQKPREPISLWYIRWYVPLGFL